MAVFRIEVIMQFVTLIFIKKTYRICLFFHFIYLVMFSRTKCICVRPFRYLCIDLYVEVLSPVFHIL